MTGKIQPMADKKQIEIALAALGEDEGEVDFITYLHALNSFKKYLSAISADVSKKPIEWIVKDLHHSKPTILLEGRSDEEDDKVEGVVNLGINSLKLMSESKDAPELNNDAINAVKDLLSDIGKSLVSAEVKTKENEQKIDINFRHAFSKVSFTNESYHEEWQGMLEEINLHGQKKTFRLYPAAGPKHITCEIGADLIALAKGNLESKVAVFGDALYRPKSKYPHRIKVQEIEVIKDDGENLSILKGSYEGLSEDLDRLDKIRSEWERE